MQSPSFLETSKHSHFVGKLSSILDWDVRLNAIEHRSTLFPTGKRLAFYYLESRNRTEIEAMRGGEHGGVTFLDNYRNEASRQGRI